MLTHQHYRQPKFGTSWGRSLPSLAFFIVPALPILLLVLGALHGGLWAVAALLTLTLLNQAIDVLIGGRGSPLAGRWAGQILPIILAVAHFGLLPLAVWSIALSEHPIWTRGVLFLAFGLYFGAVSNSVGHELIHRTARLPFTLGKWIFISHLFGHHTSAHRLIHHPYVATPFDPNTARKNESFYRFFRRAWRGSFRAGLAAENTRRGLSPESRELPLDHPYLAYILGAALFAGLALGLAGPFGLLTYLGLAVFAQGGLLLTDYVQHYGLMRKQDADGRYEPISPAHSWNAQHWFTRKLTLNAPLHSAHHWKPATPFNELTNIDGAPQLPKGPGRMSLIALFPRYWRRIMNPRLQALQSAGQLDG